jgi:hypothetical protein
MKKYKSFLYETDYSIPAYVEFGKGWSVYIEDQDGVEVVAPDWPPQLGYQASDDDWASSLYYRTEEQAEKVAKAWMKLNDSR